MINENAKKWVEALRSGKYKQGYGCLAAIHTDLEGKKTEEYCCLGVACEVAIENGLKIETFVTKGAFHEYKAYGHKEESSVLPHQVIQWLGMASANGSYFPDENADLTTLIEKNDGRHNSFDAIANIIESAPKGMFK